MIEGGYHDARVVRIVGENVPMVAYEVFCNIQSDEIYTDWWEITERVIAASPDKAAEQVVMTHMFDIVKESGTITVTQTLADGTVVPLSFDDRYSIHDWEITELPEHLFMELVGAPKLLEDIR